MVTVGSLPAESSLRGYGGGVLSTLFPLWKEPCSTMPGREGGEGGGGHRPAARPTRLAESRRHGNPGEAEPRRRQGSAVYVS